jgi:hypothetical protein
MNLKRVFHDDGTGPDAVHQFVFGDKFAGRLGQNFEYLEGSAADRYGRAQNPKLAPGKVNLAFVRRVNRLIAPLRACRRSVLRFLQFYSE